MLPPASRLSEEQWQDHAEASFPRGFSHPDPLFLLRAEPQSPRGPYRILVFSRNVKNSVRFCGSFRERRRELQTRGADLSARGPDDRCALRATGLKVSFSNSLSTLSADSIPATGLFFDPHHDFREFLDPNTDADQHNLTIGIYLRPSALSSVLFSRSTSLSRSRILRTSDGSLPNAVTARSQVVLSIPGEPEITAPG